MSFNFIANKFNEILGSKPTVLNSIKDPNDRMVASEFVKFICAASQNTSPISVEIKRALREQYTISVRFPKETQLRWMNDNKDETRGFGELADVNQYVFDDCCILHEENGILVEMVMNKFSAPNFHSHHSIKVKTARKNLMVTTMDTPGPEICEPDITEISGNSETFRFNDIAFEWIRNQFDKMNVENFSRWGRIFAEGQSYTDMKVTQTPKGSYCISIFYPKNSFFSWNRLAYTPEINPFLFENMFVKHSEKHMVLHIFIRNSARRLFVDQNSCEMIMLTIRRKRHGHLSRLTTEIIYDENGEGGTDEDEDEDEFEIKNGIGIEKHRKTSSK
jgi:hypothetical protein